MTLTVIFTNLTFGIVARFLLKHFHLLLQGFIDFFMASEHGNKSCMVKNTDKATAYIQTVSVLNERFYIVRIGDKHFVRKSPKAAREILEEEQNGAAAKQILEERK